MQKFEQKGRSNIYICGGKCMGYIYHRKEFGISMFTELSTCTILGMKLCVVTLANYWNDGRLLVADCDTCRRNKTVHHQNPLW
jgi:hypothetical protein